MSITRLSGGLTPADGSDPRTFPTIFNDTADLVEQNESDITSLDGRVTVNEGDISSLDGRVGVNEGDISSLDGRVTVNEGDISVAQGDITSLDGRVTASESDIGTAQSDITSLEGRMDSAEDEIVDLKLGDYQILYNSGPQENTWFGPTFGSQSVNNIPLDADVLYVAAAQVSKKIKIDRVGIIVETGEAGAVARLGLYENNNGLPGDLIVDAGTIDASTAGAKNITVDEEIDAGIVWCAVVLQNSTSDLKVRSSAIDSGIIMNYVTSQLAVSQGFAFEATGIDGALPASVPLTNPNIRRMINFQFRVSEVL